MNRPSRFALVALLAALATPALAADPAQDCTVCRDPLWPTLENPMPGIALGGPALSADPGAIQLNGSEIAPAGRAPGVGVAAQATGPSSVYADPMWPQVQVAAAGMGASSPAPAARVAAPAPRAAPAAVGPVAAR